MLVLADNFLLLFFFWEGVGLASYLLIGFWFTRRSAAGAAQKAFIVNRIGDLAWAGADLDLLSIRHARLQRGLRPGAGAPAAVVTGIALLLFGGAAGKSAQFPLHVWLPDAMEGPTPVSALIHAATMVTAGIYLIVRTHTFYESAPTAMLVVALIGAFTSFMAATIAWPRTTSSASSPTRRCRSSATWRWARVSAPSSGHLPPRHPRLLQGLSLPRRR